MQVLVDESALDKYALGIGSQWQLPGSMMIVPMGVELNLS